MTNTRRRPIEDIEISVSYLKEILDYNPETGVFKWIVKGKGRWRATAGTFDAGYMKICINQKMYYSHRLAWAMTYGHWPLDIDHIDLDKSNNRISNLREAPTRGHNSANTTLRSDNTTGYKGVCRHRKKWEARIGVGGKYKYIGTFATPEEAHEAYCAAAQKYFGEFARAA